MPVLIPPSVCSCLPGRPSPARLELGGLEVRIPEPFPTWNAAGNAAGPGRGGFPPLGGLGDEGNSKHRWELRGGTCTPKPPLPSRCEGLGSTRAWEGFGKHSENHGIVRAADPRARREFGNLPKIRHAEKPQNTAPSETQTQRGKVRAWVFPVGIWEFEGLTWLWSSLCCFRRRFSGVSATMVKDCFG